MGQSVNRHQGAARLFRYLFVIGPRYCYNKWMYIPVLRACLRMRVHACMLCERNIAMSNYH